MNEGDLVGMHGWLLMRIRERAGWSRPRMAAMMERTRQWEGDPVTVRSLLRYEDMNEVPPLFAKRYRDLIGHEVFDRLYEHLRDYQKDDAINNTQRRRMQDD
ncbi:MAG TPA: hypothetical protein VHI13_05325 [Candidatus Kapabacteria bacterium]|nr:hypothetical protein [Candidatus Kapabacteria bacterium]